MSNIRIGAFIFGVGFLLMGILGYMSSFVTDDKLFGLFQVNGMLNNIHLVSGVLGLLSAVKMSYARRYLQLFGIIYGLITILGFVFGGDLYIMYVNLADNLLHLLIALIALYLGFIFEK